MHHYVVNSGLLKVMENDPTSINSIFYYLFGMWGKTGINCFVLITGYYMCKSKITLQKIIKLIAEVVFYKLVIYTIFVLSNYSDFSIKGLLFCFLPISSIDKGFVSCFIAFYLAIPFLNILVNNMTKRIHQMIIIYSLFIYTLLAMIPFIIVKMNYLTWFCVLYFISSYIRIYDVPFKNNVVIWRRTSLLFVVVSMLSVLAIIYTGRVQTWGAYFFVSDSNALLAVIVSVSLFNWFRIIKLPYNKYINTIAANTFGVLLIHANSDLMRQWLWVDLLKNAKNYSSDFFALRAFVVILIIFSICIIFDQIRIRLFERPFLLFIDKKVNY